MIRNAVMTAMGELMKLAIKVVLLGIFCVACGNVALAGNRVLVEKRIKELDALNRQIVKEAVIPLKSGKIHMHAQVYPMQGRVDVGKVIVSAGPSRGRSIQGRYFASHWSDEGKYTRFRSALMAFSKQPAYVGPAGASVPDDTVTTFSSGLRQLIRSKQ